MKKVLLSAFACQPGKGSEEGNGWNWATGLAKKGYEVHCITWAVYRKHIEAHPKVENIHFYYISMPLGLEFFYLVPPASLYVYYMIWQYLAYIKAKKLCKKFEFVVAHHVSWGSLQMGSFMYKLPVPFIFGPAGGGQQAPEAFKGYFLDHWSSEIKRQKISDILIKYNPACKKMLKYAKVVLVSNPDTLTMVNSIGVTNCQFSLDTALPPHFFPSKFKVKQPTQGKLKLLWVGRFMPRKGVLLILEVMEKLKAFKGITLTIVGYGEMEAAIAGKITEYGLEETVTMPGRVSFEGVRQYYESHDAFIFTSLRDSNPAQLLEAMSFGMPVITLNLHGQAMLVSNETGILCSAVTPADTVKELREAVMDLYTNQQKITAMSSAAYNFSLKQIWPARIDNIVDQYYPD
jgi:glycosyltransferase involved in cell wall biosynthesis